MDFADPALDIESFVPVLHDWIRRQAVEGVLIDVARYAHVHKGPGVMLVGHDGDYSIGLAGGRPALRYTLKRDTEGTPAEQIACAVRRLMAASNEAVASGNALVDGEIVVSVADRLRAPNVAATHAWLVDAIGAGARDALGLPEVEVTLHDTDAREPVAATVRTR